ncbi:MAG: hypothetical protein HYU78_14180 [Rhodocyclales bacterium]|nr:hypothetical protein [Rhodocyclales bacterium]
MPSERLLTSWTDYETIVGQLLPMAQYSVAIFDRDLTALQLERPAVNEALAAFLRRSPDALLRIAVQSAQLACTRSPRLMQLLRRSAHNFHLVEVPPHLARLSDSLLLVDGAHGLIRFHQDHPRGKEILSSPEGCQPYCKRFEEIWSEGGTPISASTLGL